LTVGEVFIFAFHVPDCPLVLVHVPDIVFPAALTVPSTFIVDPSLLVQEKAIVRPLRVPVKLGPFVCIPVILFPVCVRVKRFGPCCPLVPFVAIYTLQLPVTLTVRDDPPPPPSPPQEDRKDKAKNKLSTFNPLIPFIPFIMTPAF
jgi:hypothetical protein